ncbi:hypothetical protein RHMOL_RhmolMtG0005400 (mitochondrion) [Rhododendron molle]|nr:hypothetical protein RHMOL_RhmolMtG0005400 [Rhododendron molle]
MVNLSLPGRRLEVSDEIAKLTIFIPNSWSKRKGLLDASRTAFQLIDLMVLLSLPSPSQAYSLSLLIRTERYFRKARPISFVAVKDEFDPLGSSICSEKKRETRKHL